MMLARNNRRRLQIIKKIAEIIYKKNQNGGTMIVLLVMITLLLVIGSSTLSYLVFQLKVGRQNEVLASSLHIAEAGMHYYRWHLAHEPEDYEDGNGPTGCNPCGPYIHDYEGIGQFELTITPPVQGSTVVKILSIGSLYDAPNTKRRIVAQYGLPSLARYSFLTNTNVWFGENESVIGPMHGNGGIRMDGTNNNTVTSAQENYSCGSDQGCSQASCTSPCQWISYCECPGVWGDGSGNDLWSYPKTSIDYFSITSDLSQIEEDAQDDGLCLGNTGQCNIGGNTNIGYHITFKNDASVDIWKIDSLKASVTQLNENWTAWVNKAEEINTQTFIGNYQLPDNGLIFSTENVWVDGIVNGRVTLAAAKLPGNSNNYKNIYINGNINYLARDGSHILGLLSQNNIWVPKYAPSTLVIDAIMASQNGRVARNLYWPYSVKTSIEIYGAVITNKTWTWTWVDASEITVDGYNTTLSIFDPHSTFSPPPSFPTSGQYEFISWEEILPGEEY